MEDPSTTSQEGPLYSREHCALDPQSQAGSPLFSKIPAELRDAIYRLALAEYEDINEAYSDDTCYKRPGYYAKRRTDTTLLGTCQRIYFEAWHIPWISKEQTVYFTAEDRKPGGSRPKDLERQLELVYRAHGESATEMSHLRIFAQLYRLEPGGNLQSLLAIPHLSPKCITITVRHTDWWYWESDTPIRIKSNFVAYSRLPDSVIEVRMELESLKRRQPQIEQIARLMRSEWAFRRRDDRLLVVDKHSQDQVMRWEGSSTWNECRWLRDETKPDTLEYYVQTVSFKLAPIFTADTYSNRSLAAVATRLPYAGNPYVSVPQFLQPRGIGRGFTAQEVRDMLNRYQRPCPCSSSGRSCCGTGLGAGWLDSSSDVPSCANCQISCQSEPKKNHKESSEDFGQVEGN